MKRRIVAVLLALSLSLTGTMFSTESYFSTENADVTEEDIIQQTESSEDVQEIQEEVSTEVTEEIQIPQTIDSEDEIINIPDEKLLSEICWYCDSNDDGIITKTEIEKLTNFYNNSGKINDLTGLEHAVNLVFFSIRAGDVTSIAPLAGLKKLESLSITNGQISDISLLANLTKLEALYLDNNEISDISVLAELKNLKALSLSKNAIKDFSVISELTNLEVLELDGNNIGKNITLLENLKKLTYLSLNSTGISDISILAELKNLQMLSLEKNQIKNIDALCELEYLKWVSVDFNQITEIPKFKSCFYLNDISLNGNPLKNIANADTLLKVKYPSKIDIIVSSLYVTPEMQFENFFDTSEREMYVGNQMKLALQETYLNTGKSVDITYQSDDTEKLSIDEEGWMFAKQSGTVTVTAICGNVQKTFSVTILEQEELLEENIGKVPSITVDKYNYGKASILDEKDLLWSVNNKQNVNKIESVSGNVKNYIATTIYSKDRHSWWNEYIILDANKVLSVYQKTDEDARYEKVVVEENVKELQDYAGEYICYLTEDGQLHFWNRNSDTKTVLAENVKNYRFCDARIVKIFTNTGDVMIINPELFMRL